MASVLGVVGITALGTRGSQGSFGEESWIIKEHNYKAI